MRKLLSILAALCAAVSACAFETSEVDYGQTSESPTLNLIWEFELDVYNGQDCAVISNVKNSGGATVSGDISVPETVMYGGMSYVVKKIAANAFRSQIGISSISIPRTVQDIEPPFCSGCSILSDIIVDDANPWFADHNGLLYDKDKETLIAVPESLASVQLPSTTATIGYSAFNGCFRLKDIELPAGVTEIKDNAFANCPRLRSVTFNGNAPTVGSAAFENTSATIYIPAGNGTFGAVPGIWQGRPTEYATGGVVSGITSAVAGNVTWTFRVVDGKAELYNNGQSCIGTGISQSYTWADESYTWVPDGKLRIPSTLGGYPVTRIGENAFRNCSALVNVAFPESVIEIGDYAFRNCSGIKSMTFPESVKSIGYRPFEGSSLTTLALPDSLRSLDGNPMAGCDTILTVSIGADNSFYAVVNGLLYDKDVRLLVGCPARKEAAAIAATCTTIGPEAFHGCFRTSSLTIPEHVTAVGGRAFNLMPRLASLVFPASVKAMDGAGLFADCPNLEFIGFSGDAPTVNDDLLLGTSDELKIYVNQNTKGWNGDYSSSTLPADGKWPLSGDCRRTIENLDVSAEADLKEGDVFTIINTNGTMYAWTMKVLANKGLEIIAVSPKPTGSFTIPNEFESVLGTMTVKNIGNRLFANSTGLLSVTFPNTVTNIGEEVFLNCDVLSSVSLANGLRSIGRHPFSGSAIETIALPDTVSSIDGNILAGCDPSTAVTVSEKNPYFAVTEQGVLYDKDFTSLIAVPMTVEELEIPETVTDFAEECLLGCIRLKKVSFLGNAPNAADGDDLYLDAHASLTNYVNEGNTTFGPVPGTWHLRPVVGNGSIGPEQEEPVGTQEYTDDDGNIWLYTVEDGKAELGHWGSTPVLKNPDTEGIVSVPTALGGYPLSAIPDNAFENCMNISCIEIPATVKTIGEGVFNGCTALKEIKVSPSNPNFKSKYGALYSKDGKTLVKVPAKFDFDWTLIETVTSSEKTWRITSQYFEEVGGALVLRPAETNVLSVSSEMTETRTTEHTAVITQENLFNGVTEIADYAFTDCGKVEIPAGTRMVKVISAVAKVIGDNTAIEQTVIDESVSYDLYEPLRIPASVNVIGEHATERSYFTAIADQSADRFFIPARGSSGSYTGAPASPSGEIETAARKNYCGWVSTDGIPVGVVTAKTNAKNKLAGSLVMISAKKKSIRGLDQLEEYGEVILGESFYDAGFKNKVWTMTFVTVDDGGDPLLDGFMVLSLSVKTKGKVSISGYSPDGTKISASTQLVKIGDDVYLPMAIQLYTGKKGGFAALCKVTDGKLSVVSHGPLYRKNAIADIAAGTCGVPVKFKIGDPDCELPEGYSVPEKPGWKPRYAEKTGIITGSFKVLDPKGKKKTVKVYGVSVNGTGYATSVIPKTESLPTAFAK